ncbi:rhomboid family intramembrane serine protease [Halalkalicoccus ordinarius]|uniref:rhomboid family intramembrane serine protease n=1 Tax=Halalkalicoccus ordinarius TaxID=3116651 RepID=UPI00300F43C0
MARRIWSPVLETLALFLFVFAVQGLAYVVGAASLVVGLFVLRPPIEVQPWTIVTSVYAHGSLGHLVSNSVGLVVFGWPIARATTRIRFHAFFVVTGALAGIGQVVVTGSGEAAGVLGASGAVFALMGYLIAGNRLSDGIAGLIRVPTWLTAVVFLVLAAAITVATAAPGVALIAHFTGFLLGLVAGRVGVLNPGSSRKAAEQTV